MFIQRDQSNPPYAWNGLLRNQSNNSFSQTSPVQKQTQHQHSALEIMWQVRHTGFQKQHKNYLRLTRRLQQKRRYIWNNLPFLHIRDIKNKNDNSSVAKHFNDTYMPHTLLALLYSRQRNIKVQKTGERNVVDIPFTNWKPSEGAQYTLWSSPLCSTS